MHSISHWHLLACIGNLLLLAHAGRPRVVFISCQVIRNQNRNALRNAFVKTKVHRPLDSSMRSQFTMSSMVPPSNLTFSTQLAAQTHVPNVHSGHGLFVEFAAVVFAGFWATPLQTIVEAKDCCGKAKIADEMLLKIGMDPCRIHFPFDYVSIKLNGAKYAAIR